MDVVDVLIDAKTKALESIEAEIHEISLSIQGADDKSGSAAATTGKKKSAKGSVVKKSAGGSKSSKKVSSASASNAASDGKPSMIAGAMNLTMYVGAVAVVNRAPILFTFAAAAIYLFGDYLSV